MKYSNPLQSLKFLLQADSYSERERLFIGWYKRHVREFTVDNISDSAVEENKGFAKYTEEKMLMEAMRGIIEQAEVTREMFGNQHRRKLRVLVLVDA